MNSSRNAIYTSFTSKGHIVQLVARQLSPISSVPSIVNTKKKDLKKQRITKVRAVSTTAHSARSAGRTVHLVAPQLSLGRRRSRTIQARTHRDLGSLLYNDFCVDSCGRGWQEWDIGAVILCSRKQNYRKIAQLMPEPSFSVLKRLLQ